MPDESAENRLKRLYMRSWRRGMKEMDMILGPFADKGLRNLGADELDLFEEMQAQNDQELYQWFSGQKKTPEHFQALVVKIGASVGFI